MSKVKTPIDEMTREEYQQLRDELEHLKTVERNDISEKINSNRCLRNFIFFFPWSGTKWLFNF